MKLGIVGKGGVGKTTVSALLCRTYAQQGKRVLAIDTDSNPNLGVSLGLDPQEAERAPVLPRALVIGGADGEVTPAQLVRDYALATPSEVKILHAMRVTEAGAG